MQLTPNFTLEEALRSNTARSRGLDNTPTAAHLENIRYTAEQMEIVRGVLNVPIDVSSWYRSRAVNKAVGGVGGSAHLVGLAVDFTAKRFGTPLDICYALRDSAVPYDQLIFEFGRWVHIGFCRCPKPRRQVLTYLSGQRPFNGLPNR